MCVVSRDIPRRFVGHLVTKPFLDLFRLGIWFCYFILAIPGETASFEILCKKCKSLQGYAILASRNVNGYKLFLDIYLVAAQNIIM